MPIKFPKAFERRKSSNNVLDEIPNPPEPSFRVFERPGSKSFDGGHALKRLSQGRPLSEGHLGGDQLNTDVGSSVSPDHRGSGGTNNSRSSGGHDNSSNSARFSSTSTLPSSTDMPLDDRPSHNVKGPYHAPAPPIPESGGISLRAAGRAFSFGRRKPEPSSTPAPRSNVENTHIDGVSHFTRERALTESSYASESTTTPPKILDTSLDLGRSDLDGFGNMFEDFGRRRSQTIQDTGALGLSRTESPERIFTAGPQMPVKAYNGERSVLTPSPLYIDRTRDVEASPRSLASPGSQDGLMSPHSPAMERTFSYEDDHSMPRTKQRTSKSSTMPLPQPVSPSNRRKLQQRPPSRASGGLETSNGSALPTNLARSSEQYRDDDARLVMDSLSASRKLDRSSTGKYHDSDDDANPAASLVPNSAYPSYAVTRSDQNAASNFQQGSSGPTFDSSNKESSTDHWRKGSAETTPRAQKSVLAHQEERSMFDASPPVPVRAPPQVSRPQAQNLPKSATQNKVMTPAQFERYRREQEMTQAGNRRVDREGSDDDEDDYEDDDEVERSKQLARQRRKQEAHMSVYRQQMMKVTGEQPSDLPNTHTRPNLDRTNMSAPNLQDRTGIPDFTFDKPSESGKASDDEDEDVPLGVLAAHGFPSKNRPPTAASIVSSNIRYTSETYPPLPASTSGASQGGRASGLPAFAKNLPQDPYYGASLVNQPNRESMAFGNHRAGSAYGGAPPPGPPGGLVGVIAGEEKARAARRGSPNAQGTYGFPLPPTMMPPGMPLTMGMPPMMTPGEQATVHMSEQMNHMMQMQMQWMQQMQQMMAGGMQMPPGQLPPLMPPQQQQLMANSGMLAPPGQVPRPISTGSHSAPMTPGGTQYPQSRTMSMMGPTSSPSWPPPNLRQSVAPSMMSGALGGPGSGYTPSIAPSERSNVGMPSRYRPISIAPIDEHAARASSRASTVTKLHSDGFGRDSKPSVTNDSHSKISLRPVSKTPPNKGISDDDDEEGWEQMKQKREKKKNAWRMNKKKDDNTALEFYDYSET